MNVMSLAVGDISRSPTKKLFFPFVFSPSLCRSSFSFFLLFGLPFKFSKGFIVGVFQSDRAGCLSELSHLLSF